jgi:mRNA interferase MazF
MSAPQVPGTGDIWLARLDPSEGNEQAGTRPVLVVSGPRYNRLQARLRIIVPLTTRDRQLPFHVRIDPPMGGVRSTSFVITEQPRTISLSRFLDYWGTISGSVLDDTMLWAHEFLGHD